MINAILKYKLNKFLPQCDSQKLYIFINTTCRLDGLSTVLSAIRASVKNEIQLISFDNEVPDDLKRLNIGIKYSWDYLSDPDCAYADHFFFKKLAKQWCGPEELLGKIGEYYFISSNLTLVKYTEAMRNIFNIHQPKRIIIIEDGSLLSNICGIFSSRYVFKTMSIRPDPFFAFASLNRLKEQIKVFFVDMSICVLDFFVRRYVFLFRKFNNRILIDHRLYNLLAAALSKEEFLIIPFEKGLNARLKLIKDGLFYFPLHTPFFLDFFSAFKIMPSLLRRWRKMKQAACDGQIFIYRGLCFWDAIKKYIFAEFFLALPRIQVNIKMLNKFIRQKNAKMIVMRNDAKELERTVIEANSGARPCLVVQHGIFGDIYAGDVLHAPITAVWGGASIDWFKRFGYADERFIVTGNPAYDGLYPRLPGNDRIDAKRKILEQLGLDPGKKTIVFLTQSRFLFSTAFWRGDKVDIILRGVLSSLSDISDQAQLIIKLHPYDEKADSYKSIINEFPADIKTATEKNVNVFDVLEVSDLVIMVDRSSSGLEALILDKPLIAVELHRRLIEVPFVEEGVAVGVNDVRDIGPAIRKCLCDEQARQQLAANRQRFVRDYAHKIDGQATSRVMELLRGLV